MDEKQQVELGLFPVSSHQAAPWFGVNHSCKPDRSLGKQGAEVSLPTLATKSHPESLGLRMPLRKADHRKEGIETKYMNSLHGGQVGEPRTRNSDIRPRDKEWIIDFLFIASVNQWLIHSVILQLLSRKWGGRREQPVRGQWDQSLLLVIRETLWLWGFFVQSQVHSASPS